MKTKLILLTFLIFAMANVALALNEPTWIVGRVSSSVTEERYNMILYYKFNFSIADSNNSLTIGDEVTVILATTLMQKPVENLFYNFSGYINELQTDDIPEGVFIVEAVNSQTFENDWIFYFTQIVNIISGVTRQIVDTICELIYVGIGYQVPAMIVTLIIVGLCFYFLVKHYKSIGLLLAIAVIFLVVSGVFNMLRLALT